MRRSTMPRAAHSILMDAAAKSGARRIVLGSALALFADVPAQFRMDEGWQPRDTLEAHYVARRPAA